MKNPVLVLNADYQCHRIITWQDAFIQIYSKDNGAYVVSTYDRVVKDSKGRAYNIPAVIVLSQYIETNNKRAAFSKRNIHLRDNFTCSYCGGKFSSDKLNIDHVVPRSRPDKLPAGIKINSFENCVTACLQCNSKKANKTLEEAKMHLLRVPRPITRGQKIYYEIVSRSRIPSEWEPYIKGMNE